MDDHEVTGGAEGPDEGPLRADDRRELLKKLGRFAAYTAPITLILLQSQVVAGS